MIDKETKDQFASFLGIRVLTPLEEEVVSGGGLEDVHQHDHDDTSHHDHDQVYS